MVDSHLILIDGCFCSIDCNSLEEAFKLSQNDFSERYATLGKRSTSVGDIIVDVRDEKHYFVEGIGFSEPIPHTVLSFIDYRNHMDLATLADKEQEMLYQQ